VNNSIGGTGNLVKSGTGLLVLSGANSYSGDTVINGGTLRVTGTGQLYVGPVNNDAAIYVNTNATLELDTWFDGSGLSLGNLGPAARQIVVDGGTIRMDGVTGYGRGVTVNAGGATFEVADGADWFLNIFTDDGGFVCNGDPNIVFTGAGNGSFDKAITGGGSLIKRGTGTWTIGRQQFYTGSTIVEQGQLCLRKPYLTTNSAVSIAQGAVLKLLFLDGDAIGSLVLGGTNMPPGIYSRATHPQFIIGPGSLVVGGTTNIYNGVPFNYTLDSSASNNPSVVYVMATAAAYHNDWGFDEASFWVYYDPGIPTAQANCGGPIGFGGLITVYDAMHEINHAFGSGTCWGWNGLWTGENANRLIKQIDGPTAQIGGWGVHFAPYNFNYGNEWSDRNGKVAVRIMEALRKDVGYMNHVPTISSIANQSIPVNGNTGALPFTVGDAETAGGSLVVTVSSSNTNLVPLANITLGGSGTNRTVTVTPVTGQSGLASVTLLVNDGMDTASTTFDVFVGGSYTWNVGDGNWDTSTANWTGAGTVWPTDGAIANFGGSGHTVTAVPGITAYGLNFNATGYVIQGNLLTFGGYNTISNAANTATTIATGITADGGLTKAGTGKLSLPGANTFGDALNVNAGALNLANSSSSFGGGVSAIGNASSTGAALYTDGTLDMSGALSGAGINLGNANSVYGYLRSSGTATVAGHLWQGVGSGSVSVLDLVSGTMTISGKSGEYALQLNNAGVVASSGINVTGGTLALALANDHLTINNTTGDYASINITGSGKMTTVGDRGAGIILNNVDSSTSVSTFTVANGGELDVTYSFNNNGSAVNTYFNFNGGIVKAVQTDGNGLFINNTKIYVYSGGAFIDANGFNPKVNLPLLAPTGNGVTSITLGGTTTGYIGAPLVKISGGGGGGAAAIANFDPVSGTITSITVTAPGSGYTTAPTVTLAGGTISGAGVGTATATATIGPVVGGGLTKTGTGTLQLNGTANTYPGPTMISAGTLQLNGTATLASTNIAIASGAVFDVSLQATPTLAANQALMGSGIVNGSLSSVASTKIYPGTDGTAGTLTFSNALNMSSGGHAYFDINNASRSTGNDKIVVGGALTLSGVTVHIKAGSTAALDTSGDYILFQGSSVPSVSGLSLQFDGNVPANAGHYSLQVAGNNLVLRYFSSIAPPTVTATSGDNQVALNWTTVVGSTSYNVKRATTSGGPYTIIASPTTTSFIDFTTTNGTTYYYVVSALSAGSESPNSIEVNATPASPLQAYLKFDESGGTTAADATGNGWNGTLVNSPTWVAGYSNNAVNLNSGSSQYVTLPTGVVGNLNDFTISAWVKQTTISTWSRIFDFGTGTGTYMFLTPRNGRNNLIRFAITVGGGGGEQQIDGTAALPTGVWTHVAVTLSGSTGVLYVNGMPVGTNSAMTLKPSSLGSTTLNYIGKSQYNDPYLNGQVDEFRIYSKALSPGEVATLVTPLAAPANLTATAGGSQIALSWNVVAGARSYQLFRSLTNGGPYTQVATVTATNYMDAPLVNGTNFYVVKAANAVGTSANSAQASAILQVPPPATPTGLAATAGNAQVGLTWNASSGAASYNLKRATVNGGPYSTITNVTETSYTDTDVANGTTYYYVISAVNPGGESSDSAQVAAAPSPNLPSPIHRYSFNETSGTSASDSLGGANGTLLGNAVFNGTGKVVLNGTSGTYVNLPGNLLSGLTNVTIDAWFTYTVGNNNVHLFAMDNGDGGGSGGSFLRYNVYDSGNGHGGNNFFETLISYSGNTLSGGMVLPQGVTNHVTVIYDPVGGVKRIYINGILRGSYSGTLPALSSYPENRFTLGASPWNSDPCLVGTIDEFRIYSGALSSSAVVALQTAGPGQVMEAVPGAPTGLAATAGDAAVALNWTASSGAIGYNVKRSTINGGPYTTITNLTTTSFTDTGLLNGTNYYYVVSATGYVSEGMSSTQVSARPVSTTSPTTSFAVVGNQIQLSWPADHTGWRLQVQTNALNAGLGTNWFDVTGATTTNSMVMPMNSTNGSVFYRIVYP
jgi:autotransporter-associated beta strand protein